MNKKELYTVVVLVLLMFVWMFVDATFIKPMFPEPPAPEATATPDAVETPGTAEGGANPAPLATPSTPGIVNPENAANELDPMASPPAPEIEEKTYEFSMTPDEASTVVLTFSNRGAALLKGVLLGYPENIDAKDDPATDPVVLDFTSAPALVYNRGWVTPSTPFQVESLEEGIGLRFTAELRAGILFERVVTYRESYELEVTDRLINNSGASVAVPEMDLFLGVMVPRDNISQKFGPYVGVDAEHTGGLGVKHYVKNMRKGVKSTERFEETINESFEWFGVKNKFFTQVLTLEPGDWPGPDSLVLTATQGDDDAQIGSARAAARFDAVQLEPGQSIERSYGYYIGPISRDKLAALGEGQEQVIDFRLWKFFLPITGVMMTGLNFLYGLVGNWGLAIILLTFVVRMLIWPLSLKGTENMKRMSELSPQIKELREKYKSNPQKLNVEMSALYKKNKVNPMAGCLPLLIQMPIFISLYGVLRVHVGLRFEDFLWITDLSEQEALFTVAGFTVNILPLTMGASMMYLQRMTPSNMDPQQQKIMMFMPIMFLFICYTMPSGLLLYMNTSNLVSIYQTRHTRKRDAKRKASQEGSGPATPVKTAKSTPRKKKGKK